MPYVSSLQRHLATRPGWLEWVWAALAPAFSSGRAQTAGWRAAEGLTLPRPAPISRDALGAWGVDAAGEAAIRATCTSFVRVSPVNLVLSGLLRRLLDGERPAGTAGAPASWTPPPPLGPLPALVDVATLSPPARALLATLGTTVDGQPFVPGLYRMLAGWPALLAHVATILPPLLAGDPVRAARRALLAAVDAEVPSLFASLPPLPASLAPPPAADEAGVRAAVDTYRATSPEMVVVGRMLGQALPPA